MQNNSRQYLFLLFLTLLPFGLWAQADDEYRTAQYTNLSRLNYGADTLSYFDTAIGDFHLYNPIFRNNFGILDLGNSVTASFPVVFNGLGDAGFQYGWNYLDPYLYHVNERNNLYKNTKPLTSLFYAQGAEELIYLEARHSQNVKPNWNVGIDYRRYKEKNSYLPNNDQYHGLYNTRLYNWYHTKDYRYHVIAQAVFNRVNNEVSGGLFDRESFDTLNPPARRPLTRFYGNGTDVVINKLRSNTYTVTQYYRLGKQVRFDTEAVDSLGRPVKDSMPTLIPAAQIKLEGEVSTYSNIYQINDLSGLGYEKFYLDSLSTFDSTYVRQAKAGLSFQSGQFRVRDKDTLIISKVPWAYSVGVHFNQIKVGWHNDFALYNNVYLKARIGTNPYDERQRLEWEANGYLGLTGYNAGDYDLSGKVALRVKGQVIQVEGINRFKSPDFFQFYYFGNHNFWFNRDLKKQGQTTIKVSISDLKGRYVLEVRQHLLSQYIYYADSSMQQFNGSFGMTQAVLKAHLQWKVFHWEPQFVTQTAAFNNSPWPTFASKNTVYAEGLMFKNALLAKLGIDFYYTSDFTAPVYDPAIRYWQIQGSGANTDVLQAYPYFNVFFSGRIKTVTLFAMFQNVLADVVSQGYYSSPIYPMQPRAFRFGLRWKLYE